MPAFEEFLIETARRGEAINTMFEERLFDLVGVLHKVADALSAERILGKEVNVIPVDGLLRMKLTSNRLKDQVHVQALDAAGLIAKEMEANLPPELLRRLQHVRETE